VKYLSSPLNSPSEYLTQVKLPPSSSLKLPRNKSEISVTPHTIEISLANRHRHRMRESSKCSPLLLATKWKLQLGDDTVVFMEVESGGGDCVVFSRKVENPAAALTG
jgi:hypothetical protein